MTAFKEGPSEGVDRQMAWVNRDRASVAKSTGLEVPVVRKVFDTTQIPQGAEAIAWGTGTIYFTKGSNQESSPN